jgi:2-polyprenyl-3-methyl-5-hydroxy-6-metoxy-1,4-benzoquinol methylase
VHRVIADTVTRGSRVLDAGCGIGLDAEALLGMGHDVVGIDASEGMIAEARRRVPRARFERMAVEDLPEGGLGVFDAVVLDFGVLNCLSLGVAASALGGAVRSGGTLFLVVMPRVPPAFILAMLLKGRLGLAARRLRRVADVPLPGGATVRTTYFRPREIEAAFRPAFEEVRRESLGLLLPPPGSRGWREPVLERIARVEDLIRAAPGIRDLGDHVLIVLERR